jgi:hypothetical protein
MNDSMNIRLLRTAVLIAALPLSAHVGAAQGAPSWKSEAVQIDRSPGIIAGTLLVPTGTSATPLVVMIAGSGPTDRDGNTVGTAFHSSGLAQLAESLATHGIASVRYDKRGIAGSASAVQRESDMRFDTLAADAAAWALKYRGDARFTKIIIVGHSEGALLGLIASRQAGADGYVSLEGPARRADLVLREQLAAAPFTPLLRAQSDTIMASLVSGQTYASPPPELAAVFRPSVQPYMISWFHYSAADEIRRVNVPCLIVQGTSDIQVLPAEATLLKAANPACESRLVDGMNHVLKHASGTLAEQMPSYQDPSMPLAPGLVEGVVSFVKSVALHR